MFKKIISLLTAGLLVLSLAACGEKATNATEKSSGENGGKKTITVAVMKSDRFLDKAVENYKQLHPEVNIEVKQYSTAQNPELPAGEGKGKMVMIGGPKDPKDVEKYASSMNTELMTGKGADIISMGELPYKKYADKGMLVNLSELMKADKSFDLNNYYTNLFDALKYKGSNYTLPLSYQLKLMAGDKAALSGTGIKIDGSQWTWKDFYDIAEKLTKDGNGDGIPDQTVLSNMSESDLLTSLLGSSYDKFVDSEKESADFTSQEFVDLLKLCKTLIDKKLVNTKVDQDAKMDMTNRGNTLFVPMDLRSYMDLQAQSFLFNGGVEFYQLPSGGDSKGISFYSDMLYGINGKSQYKDEAWEFLEFMLSDEMQEGMELGALPVNRKGSAETAKHLMDIGSNGKKIAIMINGKAMSPKPLAQQDIDFVNKLTAEATRYYTQDSQVLKMVLEEALPFLQGQKSAEDAARLIQSKVSTYLKE